jgi:hypothetical protein
MLAIQLKRGHFLVCVRDNRLSSAQVLSLNFYTRRHRNSVEEDEQRVQGIKWARAHGGLKSALTLADVDTQNKAWAVTAQKRDSEQQQQQLLGNGSSYADPDDRNAANELSYLVKEVSHRHLDDSQFADVQHTLLMRALITSFHAYRNDPRVQNIVNRHGPATKPSHAFVAALLTTVQQLGSQLKRSEHFCSVLDGTGSNSMKDLYPLRLDFFVMDVWKENVFGLTFNVLAQGTSSNAIQQRVSSIQQALSECRRGYDQMMYEPQADDRWMERVHVVPSEHMDDYQKLS